MPKTWSSKQTPTEPELQPGAMRKRQVSNADEVQNKHTKSNEDDEKKKGGKKGGKKPW